MSPGPDRESDRSREVLLCTDGAAVAPVTVVVVTHQGASSVVGRCIDSVRSAGGFDRLIVVDNSNSGAEVLPVDAWLRVDNEGYGAAVNCGVAAARAAGGDRQYIAVLNDDTQVADAWLEPLVAALEADPGLGAVQPKLLLADRVPVCVNSVGVTLDRAGAGNDIGWGEVDGPAWSQAREIEIFTGGAVLFRLDFLVDTNGFDERYFLYYEDVDLALRGVELGWRYCCEPASTVEHWPGSSTSQLGPLLRRVQERNRLWIAFRFGSGDRVRAALWLSIRRLRHQPRTIHARALIAGVLGAPRRIADRRSARQR